MTTDSRDRRRADRRRFDPNPLGRDSLIDALGGGESAWVGDDSIVNPGWFAQGGPPDDSRFMQREARRIVQAQDGALGRVFRAYAAARAVIGVGLVAALGAGSLLGGRATELVVLVCVTYAVQAITLWLLPRFSTLTLPLPRPRQRRRHWLATIGVDLVAFSMLHLLTVGTSFNYAALLVLPVLMAGVLTSRLLALGTTAAVALLLLTAAGLAASGQSEAPALMLQSGLAGLGLFIITLLAGELAGRLAREEQAARGSLELARQQAQLNRLVIEEMADGVMVVDHHLRVRAANPAARALLVDQGLGPPAPFLLSDQASWDELRQGVERALAADDWPEAGQEVSLAFAGGHQRSLRMRVRFTRQRQEDAQTEPVDGERSLGEPLAVLLLEDVRTAQARIRQEKLAAMGRVSAGIAHEIRNPLAAISQANALMLEDELAPPQQRLARMVAENVERLKRLVEDVMEVAPGAAPVARQIDAAAVVAAAAAEWARTVGLPLGAESRLRAEVPSRPIGVEFDPEHLRRVLVNLLDNAQRHASTTSGSIFLRLAVRDEQWAVLSVLSDGPRIAPDVERYLFEPFFSTRSRGSGLGLYICRELCDRYDASIEYRPRPTAEKLRNEFVVSLRRTSLTEDISPLHLDP